MIEALDLLVLLSLTGLTFSPAIGGILARPHGRFPGFSGVFWETYPYFLPCAVSAGYIILAFLVTLVFLKEVILPIIAHILIFTALTQMFRQTQDDKQ